MLVLKNLRVTYPNKIIIGHLSINSICNQFEMLSLSVAQYVNILMSLETKLDSTFHVNLISNKWLLFLTDLTEIVKAMASYCI